MSSEDIAFGIGCIGIGLVTLGVTGFLLGLFNWGRKPEEAPEFDPFWITRWARHRRECSIFIAMGVLIVLLVQPFINQ